MELGKIDQPAGRSFALAAASILAELHLASDYRARRDAPSGAIDHYWIATKRLKVLLSAGSDVFSPDMAAGVDAWVDQQLDRMDRLVELTASVQVFNRRIEGLAEQLRPGAEQIRERLASQLADEWASVTASGVRSFRLLGAA